MGAKINKQKVNGIKKFLFVLAIVLAYAIFAIEKFGVSQGISVTALTWSFFVFCTPIADAGFLIDFPIRIVTNIKMLISEIIVWIFAIFINVIAFILSPDIYTKTPLLELFHKIMTTPWPLWLIFILSAIGTFISVAIDDEIFDILKAKNKKKQLKHEGLKFYINIGTFIVTFILYIELLRITHISIQIL